MQNLQSDEQTLMTTATATPVPVHVADYAALAPLVALYREEMARRTAYRFQVVTLAEWIDDICRARRGVTLEDPGAVADWLERNIGEEE